MSDYEELNLILQIRNQYKRLDQLTWQVRTLQEEFPFDKPENRKHLLNSYIALRFDIQDILAEITELVKQYEKKAGATE